MEQTLGVIKDSEKKHSTNNSITTPIFSHIKSCDWENVYEPAEDTFLLIDALEKDLHFIYDRSPKVVLEVGSGSGVVITALGSVLRSSAYYLAIDIEEHACKLTKSVALHNNVVVDVIRGDLTSCIRRSSVDLIFFNPPYVVTPSDEVYSSDSITKSWAGGINGTQIINRFLNNFVEVVNKDTLGYLVLIRENEPEKIMSKLLEKHFNCKIILERKIRGEELSILKFVKN